MDAKNLATVDLGDSDALPVGSWVVAIGNPLGLGVEPTVTVGVLSARDRSIHVKDFSFNGFLQTDAAINPGNSGGPLLDIHGKVIGINSAIAPMAQGIGFAIPINQAKAVMEDLVEHGTVKRGQLGVYSQDLTADLAQSLGFKDRKGALISDVVESSPAEKAGLKRGDLIVSVEGKPIAKASELQDAIRSRRAGDQVKVTILRDGAEKTLEVTLDQLGEKSSVTAGKVEKLGVMLAVPESKNGKKPEGLVITGLTPNSKAAGLGLQNGDVLLSVNNQPVSIPSKVNDLLKSGDRAALLIQRDGRAFYLLADLK